MHEKGEVQKSILQEAGCRPFSPPQMHGKHKMQEEVHAKQKGVHQAAPSCLES
jgi:hypothetical protein